MNKTNFALLIYGIILIAGGIMGYQYANSTVSLLAGAISGAALVICSLCMMAKKPFSVYVALGLTALLTIVFALRFSKTSAFYMIFLTLISAYLTVLLLLKVFKKNPHD